MFYINSAFVIQGKGVCKLNYTLLVAYLHSKPETNKKYMALSETDILCSVKLKYKGIIIFFSPGFV